MSTILTQATQSYLATFQGFESQFVSWGQWLFFSIFSINVVWILMWHIIEKKGFEESFAEFSKKLVVAVIFLTILMHPEWAHSILESSKTMGSKLLGQPLDPSSIVSEGIAIGNLLLKPINEMGIFDATIGLIIVAVVYLFLLYVFIYVALQVSIALIMCSALITISCFFLGFAGLEAIQPVAKQTIDTVIGYCMKLLGFYVVIAAGLKTFSYMTAPGFLPDSPEMLETNGFDSYWWLCITAAIFYELAKLLPEQMARLVSGGIQESRGLSAAAAITAAVGVANTQVPGTNTSLAGAVSKGLGQIASAGAAIAKAAVNAMSSNSGGAQGGGASGNAGAGESGKPRSTPKN